MGYTPEERQKYIDDLRVRTEERQARECGDHLLENQKAQGQRTPMGGSRMKLIVVALLSLLVGGGLVFALMTGTSSDAPRLRPDQVVTVAKSYSPECYAHGWWFTPGGSPIPVEASFAVEYVGDGVWLITKTCSVSRYNGRWHFYEDTGKFVEW